jgi:hypothetical protein
MTMRGRRGSATSAACRTTRQRSNARHARGEGVSQEGGILLLGDLHREEEEEEG